MSDTTFKDSTGRVWDVALNLGAARRVDKSDFSLLTKEPFSIIGAKKETFANLLSNPSLAFAIIWAIVQPQAKKLYEDYQRFITQTTTTIDPNPSGGMSYSHIQIGSNYGDLPPEFKSRYFPFDPLTQPEEAELEFATSIDGPTKEAGLEALWRSLADFFPDLATALSMMMQQYKRGKLRLSEGLAGLEKEMETRVNQEVDNSLKGIKERIQKTPGVKPGVISTE